MTDYMKESRIVSAVNREMLDEYGVLMSAVSKAGTEYMESLIPAGVIENIDDYSPVAGVVFGHAGRPIAIMDGCDVFPAMRVVTLTRVVLAKVGPSHVVNVDASTTKGVALESALVAMSEFMSRVLSAVNQLRIASTKEAA